VIGSSVATRLRPEPAGPLTVKNNVGLPLGEMLNANPSIASPGLATVEGSSQTWNMPEVGARYPIRGTEPLIDGSPDAENQTASSLGSTVWLLSKTSCRGPLATAQGRSERLNGT